MLVSARERLPAARFEFGDIATWQPEAAARSHLCQCLAAMGAGPRSADSRACSRRWRRAACSPSRCPTTAQEPTHRLMREVAAEAPWADADRRCRQAAHRSCCRIDGYYDLLAADAANVDVWRTAYQHPMASAAAIVEWVRGTGLKPFVDRLPPDLQSQLPRRIRTSRRRGLPGAHRRQAPAGLPAHVHRGAEASRMSTSVPAIIRATCCSARRPAPSCCRCATTTAASKRACARASRCRPRWPQEFGACVFDVTLDCEDGAPVGGEAEHAALVAELALAAAPGMRVGVRGASGRPPGLRRRRGDHRRPRRRIA